MEVGKMRSSNHILSIILKVMTIIICIAFSALCYARVGVFSGVCWTITAVIWGMNLESEIVKAKTQEYIDFLEFTAHTQFCIIKNQQGELDAKQEQINNSEKHKGK